MISDKNIPRLQVQGALDSKTGSVVSIAYLWDGVAIPHVELSGPMAVRLSGLAMIQKDLGNALQWTMLGDSLLPDVSPGEGQYVASGPRDVSDLMKALFVAALSFYAKAFTEAQGRRAQMSRDWLDRDYWETHDYFMEFRHNFAAHSGDKQLEIARSFLLLIPDENEGPYRLHTRRVQPDAVKSEPEFRRLIRHALGKVEVKYNELAMKIIREIAEPKGREFWTEAAKGRHVVKLERPALGR